MKNKNNLVTIIFAVAFVGLILTILDTLTGTITATPKQPVAAEFRPLEQRPAVVTPTPVIKRDLVALSAKVAPTPAPITNFQFTDSVPAADSPEFKADDMGACFSMYTRNRNTAENTCKGEWYPVDFAPASHHEYWCASNGGNVEWLPVRFYDGRANETVKPFGSLNQCQ